MTAGSILPPQICKHFSTVRESDKNCFALTSAQLLYLDRLTKLLLLTSFTNALSAKYLLDV